MLHAIGVSKSYGVGEQSVRAVYEVSIEVARGELVALMGPSGCGKSTLLTMAGGLQRPDSGLIRVNGTDLAELSEDELCIFRREAVGYVFQDYNLIMMLSALENVALPAELVGRDRAKVRQSAQEALRIVGLEDLANRRPGAMSGGQQQRVALARAVASGCSLLLADEPTGALDSTNTARLLVLIRSLVTRGTACLIATHDPTVASAADRVLEMRDGQLTSPQSAA